MLHNIGKQHGFFLRRNQATTICHLTASNSTKTIYRVKYGLIIRMKFEMSSALTKMQGQY